MRYNLLRFNEVADSDVDMRDVLMPFGASSADTLSVGLTELYFEANCGANVGPVS